MSDDRLTILEMEYVLVAARLNTITAELALMGQHIDRIDTRTERIDAKLDRIIAKLGGTPDE